METSKKDPQCLWCPLCTSGLRWSQWRMEDLLQTTGRCQRDLWRIWPKTPHSQRHMAWAGLLGLSPSGQSLCHATVPVATIPHSFIHSYIFQVPFYPGQSHSGSGAGFESRMNVHRIHIHSRRGRRRRRFYSHIYFIVEWHSLASLLGSHGQWARSSIIWKKK